MAEQESIFDGWGAVTEAAPEANVAGVDATIGVATAAAATSADATATAVTATGAADEWHLPSTPPPLDKQEPSIKEDLQDTAANEQEPVVEAQETVSTEQKPVANAQEPDTNEAPAQTTEAAVLIPVESEDTPKTSAELNTIKGELALLTQSVSKLEALFNTKILRSEQETRIIDQMHAELQEYKSDLYMKMVRPILIDLIELREHLLKLSTSLEGEPHRVFSSFSYDIAQTLENNNVTIYQSDIGEPFDPRRHKAIEKVLTNELEADKTIADVMGEGYFYVDRPLSTQRVKVFSYQKPADDGTPANNVGIPHSAQEPVESEVPEMLQASEPQIVQNGATNTEPEPTHEEGEL